MMPFRLINASVIFQRYIMQVLRLILEKGILIYLNDILIISEIKEENIQKIN